MKQNLRSHFKALNSKKLARLIAGLGLIAAGWTIYLNNGFDYSILFFAGFLMLPLGIVIAGMVLVGIDESQ